MHMEGEGAIALLSICPTTHTYVNTTTITKGYNMDIGKPIIVDTSVIDELLLEQIERMSWLPEFYIEFELFVESMGFSRHKGILIPDLTFDNLREFCTNAEETLMVEIDDELIDELMCIYSYKNKQAIHPEHLTITDRYPTLLVVLNITRNT